MQKILPHKNVLPEDPYSYLKMSGVDVITYRRCQVYMLSLTECCEFLYCHKTWKDNIKQIPNMTIRIIHGIYLADKLQVSWFYPVSIIPVILHNPHSFIHSFTYIWRCIFHLPTALLNKTNHKHNQQEQHSYTLLLMTLKIHSEENASPDCR